MLLKESAVQQGERCARALSAVSIQMSHTDRYVRFSDSTTSQPALRTLFTLRTFFIPLVILLLAGCSFGQITPSYFGMQCGPGFLPTANNCINQPGTHTPTWPTSIAQPGLLRLWDSQVSWSFLMTGYSGGVGSYNWAQLDGFLDDIAAHPGVAADYVFGCVPCFATSGPCGTTPGSCGANTGSATPPDDLTSRGSPTFSQFVTDLVDHCSPAGHCVSTYITSYELWNEANESSGPGVRWTGTQLQLYQMLAPAVVIIKSKVANPLIFTPSITDGPAGSAPVKWMTGWLNTEVANGIISNRYNIHQYLNNNSPEDVLTIVDGALGPNAGTTGWTPLPWVMTETSWDDLSLPYGCNDGNTGTLFSSPDCIGQMVRWSLLLFSKGGTGLYWYYWNTNIGSQAQYAIAYHNMMQHLQGGSFSAPCSPSIIGEIQTWTCKFNEQNGTAALWVWTPSEAGTTYSIPNGYSDYRDWNGNITPVSPGQSVTIDVQPLMLEGTTAPTHLTASVR